MLYASRPFVLSLIHVIVGQLDHVRRQLRLGVAGSGAIRVRINFRVTSPPTTLLPFGVHILTNQLRMRLVIADEMRDEDGWI